MRSTALAVVSFLALTEPATASILDSGLPSRDFYAGHKPAGSAGSICQASSFLREIAWGQQMASRSATFDGIAMRWEESGEGFPVVLLHGVPTSPALWRDVTPRLLGVRSLAWEMLGYGGSIPEGRKRDISVARQADYLASWLDHLNVGRCVLAGHDLGGGVAQILAVRRPELCAGLFLTNSIGYDSWPIPSVKAMRAMSGIVASLPNALFKGIFSSFLHRGHNDPDRARAAVEVHWPPYRDTDGATAFARQIEALDVRDTLAIAGALPRLGVPARIVWGAADQFQKIEYGERFARDLKAPLRRIERGKHFTPEDHPEIVAEEISALVATTQAGTGARPRANGHY